MQTNLATKTEKSAVTAEMAGGSVDNMQSEFHSTFQYTKCLCTPPAASVHSTTDGEYYLQAAGHCSGVM